jgi:hypothetical protein
LLRRKVFAALLGDLYQLYTYAQRDKMDDNLTFVPKELTEKAKTPFDQVYVRKLFDLGYKNGSIK